MTDTPELICLALLAGILAAVVLYGIHNVGIQNTRLRVDQSEIDKREHAAHRLLQHERELLRAIQQADASHG